MTYSLNDIVHQLLRLVNLFFSICHDQTMKVLFLVAGMSGIRATLSFLDGAFASDGNFGARFGLHFLQSVSTGSYE